MSERFMHPNGQVPAYEWVFGDVNPPVHGWAAYRLYKMTVAQGRPDRAFLTRAFQKLLLGFTWWVNRKDPEGNNIFAGGFLGLDNIGIFDRSKPLPTGGYLQQADGTAWMAFYCANLFSIALELTQGDSAYEDIAYKFFEHFAMIISAISKIGGGGLWDEEDGFYYDHLVIEGGKMPLKVRSMVGLIQMTVLVLAYIATYNAVSGFASQGGSTWFIPDPAHGLTLGGYWYAFVALPIFQFLIFRWIYRMVVWSRFLWKVSRLDLLLTPTHPDTAGGLAFLGKGLIPFGVIFFALSAVVSSAIASRILFSGGKLEDYQWSYVALFVVGLVVFAGPMLIFVPKLLMLKQRGLMEYGTLGSQYAQAFHRKWIGATTEPSKAMLGTEDIQSLADLGNSFEIIRKMRIVPVEPSDFIAMVLPGLIPALPLAATVMPVASIIRV